MPLTNRLLASLVGILVSMAGATAAAASENPLTTSSARLVFEEAKAISDADAGRLWGATLYGPIVIVDIESRRAVANEPVPGFEKEESVFSGILPEDIGIANTAFEWNGTPWTMLMWPLADDPTARRRLIGHELWHRVQADIGFPSSGAPNLHLGTRDGRVWLRLEWRALAGALALTGAERSEAVRDALAFREQRLSLFPNARAEERAMVMHEGLAEYTGLAAGVSSARDRLDLAINDLMNASWQSTFVRSFAYATGPAYGLLLDEYMPAWRSLLDPNTGIAELLHESLPFSNSAQEDDARAVEAIDRYGGRDLMAVEDRMESERAQKRSASRRRFVTGPTLTLAFEQMNLHFDPGNVEALDSLGSVYPSMQLADNWGVLTVTNGALITSGWRSVVVPAPTAPRGRSIAGEGYRLEIADGWHLVAGVREGDYRIDRIAVDLPHGVTEVTLEARDGVKIFGDLYETPDSTGEVILLFHQGASNAKAEYSAIAPRLRTAGYRVLAIDQRRGGSRFGGENRTVAHLPGDREYSYCDCYVDLLAALDYATAALGAHRAIVWGSSYSAALVFRLAADYPDRVAAVLAFSPASGDPMEGCKPEPFAAQTKAPVLVLRPQRELDLDHVTQQTDLFRRMGVPVYVAHPAVHASSMLNPNRVDGDVEPTWARVMKFLEEIDGS